MSVRDDIRSAMMAMMPSQPDPGPLMLFVPSAAFDKGEAWVRRAYGVGTDIEIVENLPMPRAGQELRRARRYPSAMRKRPQPNPSSPA